MTIKSYLEELQSAKRTPGGGTVAAITCTIGVALLKKELPDETILTELTRVLLNLQEYDIEIYAKEKTNEILEESIRIPLAIMMCASIALKIAKKNSKPQAAIYLETGIKCANIYALLNLKWIENEHFIEIVKTTCGSILKTL